MGKETPESNDDSQNTKACSENIESSLDNILDALTDALKHIERYQDRDKILRDLTAAVIVQEISRMTVTKTRMIAGELSDVDQDDLCIVWQVLSRHYVGGKHQTSLDKGIRQLEKLTKEEARHVIYEIRCAIEPTINREMEEKTINIGLDIPVIGKIGLGSFRLNVRGTRLAVRKFQGRIIRLLVQCILWLPVIAGTIHWILWTIFDQPYLASRFENLAKVTLLFLLFPTTFGVLIITLSNILSSIGAKNNTLRKFIKWTLWFIAAAGWIYWIFWVLIGSPKGITGLEQVQQLSLPFILVLGSLGAWMFGLIFKGEKNNE